MLKVLLILVAIVCCGAQLNLPNKFVNDGLVGAPVPLVEAPVAIQEGAVAVAPAQASYGVLQPVGQYQLRSVQQYNSPIWNNIHQFRTQEVLPFQGLDVQLSPQLVQVRSDQQPVLVHYQTQSVPIQIETSHLPSSKEEVTFTQHEDEPHRVVHEVIRPVIQEIREIIQPYRKITQEIRPVQEEVHQEVAAGAPAGGVSVAAPVQAVVSAPAVVRAQAQTLVSAPTQAVYGAQYAVAVPQQAVAERQGWGVIAAPASLYTGSYIQQFVEQMRARYAQGPIAVSQPKYAVQAVQSAPVAAQSVGRVESVEPIAAKAVAPVVNRGLGRITRKYVEY